MTGLQERLAEAMRLHRSFEPELLVDQVPNRAIWREVDRAFNFVGGMPPQRTLRDAVIGYVGERAARNFVHLKHVCYAVTLPFTEGGERLVDLTPALRRLLEEVDSYRENGSQYRRCYQALMQSFFSLDADPKTQGMTAGPGAMMLRGYLSDRLQLAARRVGHRESPTWVLTLQDHSNLLTDRPCDRYVAELQRGQADELAGVCDRLGISRDSWVWKAVILAYLNEVCGRSDAGFEAAIDNALDLANGATALKPDQGTARLIVGALVKRYRQSREHPERPRLRDAAIARIGNPWLQRSQWDAWVDDEPARQMVDAWLKSRLMEDFFTLLSDQGGGTDQRRLRYWLRFVPLISDMWFVLGPAARMNPTHEFVEMRKRMEGRRLDLVQSSDEYNNAFVMRIGEQYFVEFGVKGNACFHYPADKFPQDLRQRQVSIHTLKRGGGPARHSHIPSATWEHEFDRKFGRLIGFNFSSGVGGPQLATTKATVRPAPPAPQSAPRDKQIEDILRRCADLAVPVYDRRMKGGSLWVALQKHEDPVLRRQLESCGFRYSTATQQYYLDERR